MAEPHGMTDDQDGKAVTGVTQLVLDRAIVRERSIRVAVLFPSRGLHIGCALE